MNHPYTAVVLGTEHGALKVYLLETARLSETTKDEMRSKASAVHMSVRFFSVGFEGIESVKWDIEHINDTKLD